MDPILRIMSLKETNKYANVSARAARNEAAKTIQKVHKPGLLPASYLAVAMTKSRIFIYFSDIATSQKLRRKQQQ